jgi:hypothetical protein
VFIRSFAPSLEEAMVPISMSTMSREGECSLAREHGEIVTSKKEVISALTKANLEAKAIFVREVKELVDLELKVASVDALTMNENKIATQANLVPM